MTYNLAVQKKNTRNSPRVAPRKLALLVAAVLAGPAAANPIAYGTYTGNTTQSDFGGALKVDAAGFLFSARVNSKTGADVVTVAKLATTVTPPVTGPGAQQWITPLRDNPGTRLADLALGPTGTPYIAGTTMVGLFRGCPSCVFLGTSSELNDNGAGDAYVLSLNSSTGTVTNTRYLGGSGADEATAIAVDVSGNVYVTGTTKSGDFPATVGSYHGGTDVFVARYSPDLTTRDMVVLLGGSGDDTSNGIAVDSSGNIYVAMNGASVDFPPDSPGSNAYLVKLGPDGSFQHSTAIGASGHVLAAVQLDPDSQPIVAGTRFELGDPSVDAFVARISDAGSLGDYQRFGGSSTESVRGLTVSGDAIYVTGETFSSDFPVIGPTIGSSGGSEAFVARLGPEGLDYATRFGSSQDDYAQGLAVLPNGDVYVSGSTGAFVNSDPNVDTSDFPITGDAVRHAPAPIGGTDLFLVRLATQFDLSTPALSVAADDAEKTILITRTGSLIADASIKWSAVNGTAVAGTHYGTPGSAVPPSGTVNFPAGVGSVAIRVGASVSGPNTIRLIGTASFATPRTFSVKLSVPVGVVIGDVGTSVVTVSQGHSALAFDQTTLSVLENAGSVTVRVKRTDGSNLLPATVNYATVNVTALAPTHYTAASGTLTFADGDPGPKDIVIPIIDNAVANAARSFRVTLAAPTGLPISGGTFATVTILDEDNTIALGSTAMVATEGSPNVTLQVRRTGSATLPASVNWATQDDSAHAGADYGVLGDPTPLGGTINWAAGDVATKTIVVPLLDDGMPEPAKKFQVKLSGVSNATLGTATTTVTLNDNDRGFAFADPEYSVIEGQPSVTLTVRRLGPATTAATVNWTTANGTATAGQDFGTKSIASQRSGVLSWAIGDVANKTIVIPILDDTTVDEPPETFTVTLSTSTAGYTIVDPGVATVTINDNDLSPRTEVGFGQAKYLTTENAGTVTLDVLRTDLGLGFGLESRVNYATQAGTALATADFTMKTGTLVWAAGDSSPKQITVAVTNDTVAEPPESFKVVLSAPNSGTKLGAATQASVVILDDDEKFPPHGAIPDGFSMPLDATHGWHVAGDPGAYEGVYALRSDEIDDGETAALQMSGAFGAGSVSFRVRISSEAGFDVLKFYIDGALQTTWSGTSVAGWQMSPTYLLTEDVHTLRWEYVKDGSLSMGQDAAFIDGLVTPTFTP